MITRRLISLSSTSLLVNNKYPQLSNPWELLTYSSIQLGKLQSFYTVINNILPYLPASRTSIAGEFDALQEKDFENMLRINVLGSIYPTYALVPLMKRQRSGRIVFVSSQVAQAALHGMLNFDIH